MYVDAILDRKTDTIRVSERHPDGSRKLRDIPAQYVFYYEDAAGTHNSLYGHRLKRYTNRSAQKFRAALENYNDRRLFEADINPVFRALETNYLGAETPNLHLGFFDIEAGFDTERGFAPTDNPFNEVTAVTLYRSHDSKLVSFVLKPSTLDYDTALAIVNQFEYTWLFTDEKELLLGFLDAIDDVDVLTGWNCIPQSEHVWLADRIVSLCDVKCGMSVHGNGQVLAYHDSGMKIPNKITLDNGYEFFASDEHRIPVFCKAQDDYKYPASLMRSRGDHSVSEIKTMLADQHVYMELNLRQNTNSSYTYRDFVTENLETILSYDVDIVVEHTELKEKIKRSLEQAGTFQHVFPYDRKFSYPLDYPEAWLSKNFPCLTIADLQKQVSQATTLSFKFDNSWTTCVNLDDPIPSAALQVLGLTFTDGTFDRRDKFLRLYSKYPEMLVEYVKMIESNSNKSMRTTDGIHLANDGISAANYVRSNYVGLLLPMIYAADWTKHLNVLMLSRLSLDQFASFVSGLVDGDGPVRPNELIICNFDGNVAAIHELLLWNGVMASCRSEHEVAFSCNKHNEQFVRTLLLKHPIRKAALLETTYFEIMNAPNKLLKKFLLNDRCIMRVRSIEPCPDLVPMADIQTESSYFCCKGVTVHNSGAYDVPYLVNRITRLIGKDATRKFCLWDQLPSGREYKNKFGRTVNTYDFVGRVHLDYMELYAKHNPKQQLSYALNAIGQSIVGETKTPYEGTLDDLYKKDFPKFIEYNRQDVMLMVKIDQKLRYIELHNQMAHTNTVLFKTTMGSVALIEQAIINEMHAANLMIPNRKSDDADDSAVDIGELDDDDDEGNGHTPVVGAYVADPKVGLRRDIGCVDLGSLYPNTIRAFNISPETLVGQVRLTETMQLVQDRTAKLSKTQRAEAWEGIFCTLEVQHMIDQDDNVLTVDFVNLQTDEITTIEWRGKQLHAYVFEPANHVCITANGTLFRTDVEGIIPRLLGRWYSERKELQKKQSEFEVAAAQEGISEAEKQNLLEMAVFWEKRQLARKILLNSLYGAMLNVAFRLGDDRFGQSVTLSGRCVDRHMISQINQIITGNYDHRGDAIVYADTDSCYFSASEYTKGAASGTDGLTPEQVSILLGTREDTIVFYDTIAELTNATFSDFLQRTFNVPPERGAFVKAGRELVASTGLFIKKKKYAVLMYDKEGHRLDKDGKPGKLKIMGLDLKRSDTPKYMQDFLEKLLLDLLTEEKQETMYENIKQFRGAFKGRPGWEKGSPRKVSDLSGYTAKLKKTQGFDFKSSKTDKVRLPGHVLASMNWNTLCEMQHDHYTTRITDGTRIIVCKLKPNSFGMTSIAYPVDEPHLPAWFKELPFDDEAMEETIVDNKIGNLVGVLNWDIQQTKESQGNEFFNWN